MRFVCVLAAGLAAVAGIAAPARGQWAGQVVSYVEGVGVQPGYNVPASTLGQPTRFTGVGSFPGAVTPFNPAFLGSEVASIGSGGHLVVRFDTPVLDDPLNLFGVDLLVFGNAGYIDTAFPAGVMGGVFGAGSGSIEVSADGVNWLLVPGVAADSPFPTLGYLDLTDPYATSAGAAPSDFTRPVNPSFDPQGLNFQQIVAAYAGSGGGTGIDLASVGLAAISYVRISNAAAGVTVDIDALADVTPIPAPGIWLAVAVSGLVLTRRKRGARGGRGGARRRSLGGRL